jgi:pyrophosphatase PpaX
MQIHRANAPLPPDDVWMKGLGTPLWVQFRHWTDDEAEIEAMVATYRAYNLHHHDSLVKPYEGVVEEVVKLKRLGKRLGLVTSKLKDGAMKGLRLARLDQAFEIVIGAGEVTHPKPHPEPVLKALALLDAAPERTVFIGDSRHDLESGRAAGVKTAAVLWGPFNRSHLEDLAPDFWLEKPDQLAQLYDP